MIATLVQVDSRGMAQQQLFLPTAALICLAQGTAHPLVERERLGLRGLLPPRVLTMEQQVPGRGQYSPRGGFQAALGLGLGLAASGRAGGAGGNLAAGKRLVQPCMGPCSAVWPGCKALGILSTRVLYWLSHEHIGSLLCRW